jgi:hypothetical protein
MYKFLIYLSNYFCLTCLRLSFSPSSEAGVQLRQWFKSTQTVCQITEHTKCRNVQLGALLYSGTDSLLLAVLHKLPRQFNHFREQRSLFPVKGIKLWFHGCSVHSQPYSWITQHFQSYFNPVRGRVVRRSNSSVGKIFFPLHTRADQSWGVSSLLYEGYWDVVLTTHPHLMQRLSMRTAIPQLPLCAFYGMLLGNLTFMCTFYF